MTHRIAAGRFVYALIAALAVVFCAPARGGEEAADKSAASCGAKIQRTMTLLATSTPQRHNRVRILFYGQSVTAGVWTKDVAEQLRKAYPHADLEIENRAIGGFSAPALIHTAESDLYPFYPDLMIFHVYGGHQKGELEQIIARTRQRTTAEILIRTPHYRWPKELPRDGSPDDRAARQLSDEDDAQAAKIRQLAARYGCELADVRRGWQAHMRQNRLFPKDLLGDSVHLNPAGNRLMAELVMQHLHYQPQLPSQSWKNLVREIPIGDPAIQRTADGGFELAFEGNRVDVLAAPPHGQRSGTARVLIDGKPPSANPELYYATRPSQAPGVWWPAISRVDAQKPRVVEKWTLRVLSADPDGARIPFEVAGSQTGPDGAGTSTERFVSRSGRVVIEPARWNVRGALRYRKIPMPKNFEVTWEVQPLFADVFAPPSAIDPTHENPTTIAQGLRNARHTLRLVPKGDGQLAVGAIRVYRPPLPE